MVEKIRPIHQADPWYRLIENDQLQRNITTIQRPVGRWNQRYIHMGDWTVSYHENEKTVREREPNSLPLYRLYTLLRLHFFPVRNKHHSRADFFNFKTRTGRISCRNLETHSRGWKELPIRKNNGSWNTCIKISIRNWENYGWQGTKEEKKKEDLSVEAITDTIHEFMYKERTNRKIPKKK